MAHGEDLPSFGRYTVLNLLGKGGTARVYRAVRPGQMGFGKEVALKIIDPEATADDEAALSLINEARLGGLLRHRNIVAVDEFEKVDDTYYIAMEYVDGWALERVLTVLKNKGKHVPPTVVLDILMEICEGLHYAHERTDREGVPLNIVHRDLKPGNIMISRLGEVKIADFGTAKASTNVKKTAVGFTRGTPAYMSPEQVAGEPIDRRSDIFAMGAILYELVTLKMAFPGENMFSVMRSVLDGETSEARARMEEISPELAAVMERCMAPSPDDRYQTAQEVHDDLKVLRKRRKSGPAVEKWVRSITVELPSNVTGEFGHDIVQELRARKADMLRAEGAAAAAPPEKRPANLAALSDKFKLEPLGAIDSGAMAPLDGAELPQLDGSLAPGELPFGFGDSGRYPGLPGDTGPYPDMSGAAPAPLGGTGSAFDPVEASLGEDGMSGFTGEAPLPEGDFGGFGAGGLNPGENPFGVSGEAAFGASGEHSFGAPVGPGPGGTGEVTNPFADRSGGAGRPPVDRSGPATNPFADRSGGRNTGESALPGAARRVSAPGMPPPGSGPTGPAPLSFDSDKFSMANPTPGPQPAGRGGSPPPWRPASDGSDPPPGRERPPSRGGRAPSSRPDSSRPDRTSKTSGRKAASANVQKALFRRQRIARFFNLVLTVALLFGAVLLIGPMLPGGMGARALELREQVKTLASGGSLGGGAGRSTLRAGFTTIAPSKVQLGLKGETNASPSREPIEIGAFAIMTNEVTVSAFTKACPKKLFSGSCRDWPGQIPGQGGDHPVVNVTWEQARDFCAAQGWRLPTEAEWEAAARGSEGRKYPWGNKFRKGSANYCDLGCDASSNPPSTYENDGYQTTSPVGAFPKGKTPEGVKDLSGNVSEWTLDCWAQNHFTRTSWEPTVTENCATRVVRGGSWRDPDLVMTSTRRTEADANTRSDKVGFRCVQGPPIPGSEP